MRSVRPTTVYASQTLVTAPPGFAPAVGIPLTFSGGAPEVPEALGQAAPAVAAYTTAPARPPIPDLPERAPTKEQRLAAASQPPIVAPTPKPAVKVSATEEPQKAPAKVETFNTDGKPAEGAMNAAKSEKNSTSTKANDGAAAGQSPGFTIINGPKAAAAERAPPKLATEVHASTTTAPIETSAVTAPADR